MKLKPHQRPILTRYAFVMPVKLIPWHELPDTTKITVPCEPEDAEVYRVVEYVPSTGNLIVRHTVTRLPKWKLSFALAQTMAEDLDRVRAAAWGTPR